MTDPLSDPSADAQRIGEIEARVAAANVQIPWLAEEKVYQAAMTARDKARNELARHSESDIPWLLQRVAQAAQELLKWKTCSRCGEVMTAPGHCDSAESERVKGLEQMHEETLERAEKAESDLAGLGKDYENLLKESNGFEIALAAARQEVADIKANRDAWLASQQAALAADRDAMNAGADLAAARLRGTKDDDDSARSAESLDLPTSVSTRPPSPHIDAVNYARQFLVPLYRNNEEGTPYERGMIRQVSAHWLAGYFAAIEGARLRGREARTMAVDPVDTDTPKAWVAMDDDAQWAEYVRVRTDNVTLIAARDEAVSRLEVTILGHQILERERDTAHAEIARLSSQLQEAQKARDISDLQIAGFKGDLAALSSQLAGMRQALEKLERHGIYDSVIGEDTVVLASDLDAALHAAQEPKEKINAR